jgi:hypothetical protein
MIAEFDLDGIFLSSMVATATAALVATMLLRRGIARTGLYRLIWHPALFDAALFLLIWAGVTTMLHTGFSWKN